MNILDETKLASYNIIESKVRVTLNSIAKVTICLIFVC